MFEDYIITEHVVERYNQRISESKSDVEKRIRRDLSYKRVKRIVNNGNTRHIFTFNSKEFIFKKGKNCWLLITVIKRNRENNSHAINRRIKVAA